MTIRKRLIFFLLLFVILSTTGCFGGLTGYLLRESMTGKTYSELKESYSHPLTGSGRLFVYALGGGPNLLTTISAIDTFTVDEHLYSVVGNSYCYIDLPVGKHKVTEGDILGFYTSRYGKNVFEFDLKDGETRYIRIAVKGIGAFTKVTPETVEPSIAEKELTNLNFDTKCNIGKTIGEVPI